MQYLATSPRRAVSGSSVTHATELLDLGFPQDAGDIKPTRFGNVLAAAAEHPRLVYAMDGALWWPRLMPLLPANFVAMLGGVQAPTMAFVNLSVVFFALALSAAAILVLAVAQWVTALVVLVAGLVLARLCYQAAVSQALELGSVIRVAFDLYRFEILTQLHLESPSDLGAERAVWQRLTDQILGLPEVVRHSGGQRVAPAQSAKAAETPVRRR
jgi:hypothetical protein